MVVPCNKKHTIATDMDVMINNNDAQTIATYQIKQKSKHRLTYIKVKNGINTLSWLLLIRSHRKKTTAAHTNDKR